MASPPIRLCLSCQTSLETNDPAVFRDGVKIAHVRCWRLKHLSPPPSQEPDAISGDGHRPASTLTGPS
jgi:hypothetical protein